MNTRYTDVDRLILGRWEEVAGLRHAFDELMDRMGRTIESSCERVELWLGEQGYECEADVKQPSLLAWKKDWEKPRGEPLVYFQIAEFAPIGYGKVDTAFPFGWLLIEGLERLRLKEPDRVRFAKDLKAALIGATAKWDHEDADERSQPLGRDYIDVTDIKRLELVANPASMVEFLQAGFTELFELAPAIDDTLKKYREGR